MNCDPNNPPLSYFGVLSLEPARPLEGVGCRFPPGYLEPEGETSSSEWDEPSSEPDSPKYSLEGVGNPFRFVGVSDDELNEFWIKKEITVRDERVLPSQIRVGDHSSRAPNLKKAEREKIESLFSITLKVNELKIKDKDEP